MKARIQYNIWAGFTAHSFAVTWWESHESLNISSPTWKKICLDEKKHAHPSHFLCNESALAWIWNKKKAGVQYSEYILCVHSKQSICLWQQGVCSCCKERRSSLTVRFKPMHRKQIKGYINAQKYLKSAFVSSCLSVVSDFCDAGDFQQGCGQMKHANACLRIPVKPAQLLKRCRSNARHFSVNTPKAPKWHPAFSPLITSF